MFWLYQFVHIYSGHPVFFFGVLPPLSSPANYIRNAHKWCTVMGYPRSARLDVTPAMDLELREAYAHTCTKTKEK